MLFAMIGRFVLTAILGALWAYLSFLFFRWVGLSQETMLVTYALMYGYAVMYDILWHTDG